MRSVRAWGLMGAFAFVMLCNQASAQEKSSLSWWERLIIGKREETSTKANELEQEAQAKKVLREKARILRKVEQAALQRRQDACLKLQEMALLRDDTDLYRRAQELEERAWKVYLQRTAQLAGERATSSKEEPEGMGGEPLDPNGSSGVRNRQSGVTRREKP